MSTTLMDDERGGERSRQYSDRDDRPRPPLHGDYCGGEREGDRGGGYSRGGGGKGGGGGSGDSGMPRSFGAGGSGPPPSRPPPPNIDPTIGDWCCPKCSNWNWARRNDCNKCGTNHPTRAPAPPRAADRRADQAMGLDTGRSYAVGGADKGQKRTGEGGGFREYDEEEESRRKRRAQEERKEKEERKAEKKKCDFCKRFSCIC